MDSQYITFFKDSQLTEAENLLKDNPDIFNKKDYLEFRDDLLQYLIENPSKDIHRQILVLLVGKNLIGLIMIEKLIDSLSYFRVKWLVVKKSEQKKGYGTKLMEYAIHEIRKLRGKYVCVETANEKHNFFAKQFYQNLGFKRVGVLPDYYPPPVQGNKFSEDSVLYYKKI